jgi:hypothetical protein
MNLRSGFIVDDHARLQMKIRRITEEQIEVVPRTYHTSYPAEPFPDTAERSMIYVGSVGGRDLKVYILQGSDPPYVKTVVWKGEEQG